jgi:hypothetical protein
MVVISSAFHEGSNAWVKSATCRCGSPEQAGVLYTLFVL